ncbi:hypothetical protein PV327_006948 [Microctonus hyperodae]|uniref:Kinase n=1 Tax=Microctonus hyperodae TaxID=165561 RepID=A0AA39F5F6_MICHY|nr:hypothetical protein PV327_006948 [Microctonus hyperodae]
MKSKASSKSQSNVTELDSSEENEIYDQFNAIMVPVSRTLSKSPQSDEGIEPDSDSRKTSVTRCWSLDSSSTNGDDDISKANQWQKRRSRLKVSRCYSADSAVISDDDHNKAWDTLIMNDRNECDSMTEERPRYWRTPSVVVSDYSDYSYLEEKFDRNDPDFEKYEGISGSASQASSCSCLDCDDIREFQDLSVAVDNQLLKVCGQRRHSDSCCVALSTNDSVNASPDDGGTSRRNSCVTTPNTYLFSPESQSSSYGGSDNIQEIKTTNLEHLSVPPVRKISDCSTNSSLSGDDFEVTELQPLKRPQSSGWRKLRNIVQWTPFFQTYKKQRYPWIQLGGHQGNFRAGPTPGTILKKLCPQEEACFRLLMHDVLRPYVPEFKGVLEIRVPEQERNSQESETGDKCVIADDTNKNTIVESYLQLQDLLGDFDSPCVMDCKVGVRTYLESELAKAKERPKLRKDMYEKMIQVDPTAPNAEERRLQGVTKPRYMVWRETISSTATLGFRVEGIKFNNGGSTKDFKTTRTREQVTEALKRFVENYSHAVPKYLQRLKAIRATLKASSFFTSHEIVGSSLLFVHDANNAGIWMIDFAKSLPLPANLKKIEHDAEWQVGNHEDGYLIGVNNLIDIFEDIKNSIT